MGRREDGHFFFVCAETVVLQQIPSTISTLHCKGKLFSIVLYRATPTFPRDYSQYNLNISIYKQIDLHCGSFLLLHLNCVVSRFIWNLNRHV